MLSMCNKSDSAKAENQKIQVADGIINTEGSENLRWGGAPSKGERDEHGTDKVN